MSISSRKYPRIPITRPATLDLQLSGGQLGDWTSVAVTVKTASCEGVGLKLEVEIEKEIRRNYKGILHFRAGNSPVEIPARIAWVSSAKGETHLGLRLDLALAQATCREIYSSWIVASIIGLRDFTSPDDTAMD